MACHGFGFGKIRSAVCKPEEKHDIARAISKLDKVAWAHVVNKVNWKLGIEPPEDPDIVFEMKENCVDEIERFVRKYTEKRHTIQIQVVITVDEESYVGGESGRHPPAVETAHSST